MLPFKASSLSSSLQSLIPSFVSSSTMGNETSGLPSDSSMTPMSEASFPPVGGPPPTSTSMEGVARSRPMSRRSSTSSSAQHSPVEPPDVDLSHLNEAERAQIAAVIARAKEVQEQEAQMVKNLEDEFNTFTATVDTRRKASLAGSEHSFLSALTSRDLCAVCSQTELTDENSDECIDCGEYVCSDCGQYQKGPSPQIQEWICMVCMKRRKLMTTTGMWYYGKHAGQDLPNIDVKSSEQTPQKKPNIPESKSEASLPVSDKPPATSTPAQTPLKEKSAERKVVKPPPPHQHRGSSDSSPETKKRPDVAPKPQVTPPPQRGQQDKAPLPKSKSEHTVKRQPPPERSAQPKRPTTTRMRSQPPNEDNSDFSVDVDALVAKAMEIPTPEPPRASSKSGKQISEEQESGLIAPSSAGDKRDTSPQRPTSQTSRSTQPSPAGSQSRNRAEYQDVPMNREQQQKQQQQQQHGQQLQDQHHSMSQAQQAASKQQQQSSHAQQAPTKSQKEPQERNQKQRAVDKQIQDHDKELLRIQQQQQLLEHQRMMLQQQPRIMNQSMQQIQFQEEQRIRHQQQLLEQQRQMMLQSKRKHEAQQEKEKAKNDNKKQVNEAGKAKKDRHQQGNAPAQPDKVQNNSVHGSQVPEGRGKEQKVHANRHQPGHGAQKQAAPNESTPPKHFPMPTPPVAVSPSNQPSAPTQPSQGPPPAPPQDDATGTVKRRPKVEPEPQKHLPAQKIPAQQQQPPPIAPGLQMQSQAPKEQDRSKTTRSNQQQKATPQPKQSEQNAVSSSSQMSGLGNSMYKADSHVRHTTQEKLSGKKAGQIRETHKDNDSPRSSPPTQSRTRGAVESSESDRDSDRERKENNLSKQRMHEANSVTSKARTTNEVAADIDSDDGSVADEDPSRRKSPRPQHLVLSRQHSSTSNSSEDENVDIPARNKKGPAPMPPQKPKRPLLEKNGKGNGVKSSTNEKASTEKNASNQSKEKRNDIVEPEQEQTTVKQVAKVPARSGGEGAEMPVKKKPFPLDRKTSAEHKDSDRTVSPGGRSTKSPKSPPRSPNRMRYRESPPRSPPIRSISPSKSPTERFPNNYVDIAPAGMPREGTYGEEYENVPSGNIFSFDQSGLASNASRDSQNIHERPPPKPARTNNHYSANQNQYQSVTQVLDLASYAATVANDTDHLTSMSVSPTNLRVPEHTDDEEERSPEQDSSSPVSPNYYEEVDEVEVGDPTPKSIDYQGSKRQKVKPPTTDWSPVTDLSPIIDVSPSVERLEQEKMIAEQLKLMGSSNIGQPGIISSPPDELVPQKPKVTSLTPRPKEEEPSSLRRFKIVEDISSLDDSLTDMPRRELQRSERMENIKEMIHGSQPGNEVCQALQKKAQLESADSKESLDSEVHLSDSELKRTYHRVEKEEHLLSDDEQEIDLDADIPPKPWDQNEGISTIKRAPPVRSLSESESNIRDIDEFPSIQERKKQFERQIAQQNDSKVTKPCDTNTASSPDSVSSSVSFSSSREGRGGSPKARDSSKVKPCPLRFKRVENDVDDPEFSPHYKVLTSPTSPKFKLVHDSYTVSPQCSPQFSKEERAYLYPSPGTPPDSVSPPTPRSPSGNVTQPVGYPSQQACSVSPMPASNECYETTPYSSQVIDDSVENSQSQKVASPQDSSSPGSPNEGSRKVRRRLPPVPQGTEAVKPVRRPRSHSADSRLNSDKDFLRKRLMEKEVESRRSSGKDKESKPTTRGRQPATSSRKTLPATTVASASAKSTQKGIVSKPKTTTGTVTASTVASISKPQVTPVSNVESKEEPKEKKAPTVPPKPNKAKSKPKESQPIEMVSIHGLKVPIDVKSFKQRIKEEMQIVTATRRLKLDEMEEIRRMEAELAERDKERKLKIAEENRKRKQEADKKRKEKEEREKEKERERIEREQRILADKFAPTVQDSPRYDSRKKLAPQQLSTRTAQQQPARRGRHRRQNSDPMIAKFSPIEEARDIENDIQFTIEREARRLAGDLSKFSPQLGRHVRRLGSKTPPATSDYLFAGGVPLTQSALSRSSELLDKYSQMEQTASRLSNSRSESNLPMTMSQSRSGGYYSDEEDQITKEAKKYHLQAEIEKRKRQIEETARLRYEIQRLAENANVATFDVPYSYPSHQPPVVDPQTQVGIIKPLDYQIAFVEPPDDYSQREYAAYREMLDIASGKRYSTGQYDDNAYSSGEYIAHRGQQPRMQMPSSHMDAIDLAVHSSPYAYRDPYSLTQSAYVPPTYANSMDHLQMYPQEAAVPMAGYHLTPQATQGIPSSLSMPLSSLNANYRYDQVQPMMQHAMPSQMAAHVTSVPAMTVSGGSSSGALTGPSPSHTDTDATSCTPGSDHTPAMPILGDVTMRSRSLLRDIGSRPLSDDMEKYLQVHDPSAAILRAGSDRSIAESVDEHVMEGGVTIRRQSDKQKKEITASGFMATTVRKYDFPTKRILVTRDPKDRTVKGNGIGLKIVGGKMPPDGAGDSVAYVAAIYPGGVADQLHGELQEGDQVLEWNGTVLTGKSYEEVQQIISAPLGEIEIVVRPGANLSTKHSQTMSTLESGSCHSSYDNLESSTSDYEEFDRYLEASDSGVDPNALAAQLEGIPREPPGETPGTSPSSSQQDMYLTPSMSTPASSEPTDPPSPSLDLPPTGAAIEKSPLAYVDTGEYGEIQLQMSYDDYDGTLNIHVIQARGLKPKDTNGFSDPFCKVCLLPGRTAENKRRTKYIPRTLNPEWHQTLVFMKISREELHTKTMEVAVWDYDRFKANDFLGEVLLSLSDNTFLDNKPHWYRLHEHVAGNIQRVSKPRPLSPPTSSSSSASQRSRPRHTSKERQKVPRSVRGDGIQTGPRSKHLVHLEKSATTPRSREKRSHDSRSRDLTKQSHQSRDVRSVPQRSYADRSSHQRSRDSSTSRSSTHDRNPSDAGCSSLSVKSNTADDGTASVKSRSRSRDVSPARPHQPKEGCLQSQVDPKISRYSPGLGRRHTSSSSHESNNALVSVSACPLATLEVFSCPDPSSPSNQVPVSSFPQVSSSASSSTHTSSSSQPASSHLQGVLPIQDVSSSPLKSPLSSPASPLLAYHESLLTEQLTVLSQQVSSLQYMFSESALKQERESSMSTSRVQPSPLASPRRNVEQNNPTTTSPAKTSPSLRFTSASFEEAVPEAKTGRHDDITCMSSPVSSTFGSPSLSPTSPYKQEPPPAYNHLVEPTEHGVKGSPSSVHSANSANTASASSYISNDTMTSFSYDSALESGEANNVTNTPLSFSSSEEEMTSCSLGIGQILPSALWDRSSDFDESISYCVTGEILLGLRHDNLANALTVSVVHCMRLWDRILIPFTPRDWYIKLYLRLGDDLSRVKKRKTHIQKCITDPTFNEIFTYHTDCVNSLLEVSLWINKGLFGPNKAVGLVLISLPKIDFTRHTNNELFTSYKLLAERR